MKKPFSSSGFSLVELIVAVGIAGMLMLGTSVFFVQHLSKINTLEDENDKSRDQFLFQELLRKKFMEADSVAELKENHVILKNKKEAPTPFTFIGLSEGKIGITDFFGMQGIEAEKVATDFNVPQATGVSYANPHYYVASFGENRIYRCSIPQACEPFAEDIKNPLNLATDGTSLFISQSQPSQVLQLDLANPEKREVLGGGFKAPTGLAYYKSPLGETYLFVADGGAKQVRRLNLTHLENELIMGSSSDKNCDSSALFCGLDFPTALAISGESLFVADAGSGRILRVYDPSPKKGLLSDWVLNFEIEANWLLEKIVLTGPFEGGSFEKSKSNLAGNDYNKEEKTFNNPIFQPEEYDACKLSDHLFTSQNLSTLGFQVGDQFRVGTEIYEIESFLGQKNCESNKENDDHFLYQTQVNPLPSGTAGQWAYGNNPGEVTLGLNGVNFNQSGFIKVMVNAYDKIVGPVEEKELLLRVGDGELGTMEDKVEVWMENLAYPGGLKVEGTDIWVLETGKNQLSRFNLETKELINQGGVGQSIEDDFIPFHSLSSFSAENFSLEQAATGLLELSFTAKLNDTKSENYSIDVALSKNE